MSTGYQIYDQNGVYFLTFTIVDWVDIFSRKIYKDILINSLQYCIKHKGFMVYCYVIMSNHIHIIMRSNDCKLSDAIRDFKKYTSAKIIEAIQNGPESRRAWLLHRFKWAADHHSRNTTYQVWTHENHAIEIFTNNFFISKANYIHLNPVRAGYVKKEEDYVYSSANPESLLILSEWN
jgi:REP element-mobilizing transposase RayT